MPRTCTVCTHAKRSQVEQALVSGESYRDIARRFGVSKDALARHRSEHLPRELAKATEAAEIARADTLLERLLSLNCETLLILAEARKGKDNYLALQAIARAEKQLELQAKLIGELDEGQSVSVVLTPEWAHLRTVIVQALRPYPEAQAVLLKALP